MKILHVIPFFSQTFGGSVMAPYQLTKALAIKGHDITILTSDYRFDKKFAQEAEADNVKVIPFRTIAHFGLFIYTPSIKTWLKKNIQNYDAIHLHNFRSYQNSSVSDLAIKNKIPYILQAHGSILPIFQKQMLKYLYDFVWGKKLLKNASKIIAVSKIEKQQFLQMGTLENKIEIIPNGLDTSEYKTLPEYGTFRKKYGIASDENIILYLGRLHKSKGIDFLINGFSSLLVQNNKVKLVIVGPDEGYLDILTEQVKKLKIEENIIITGPLYKNEKYEAFVDADVLAYLGQIEIFGLVPFEAIMCGTPVIVSNNCGCGQIIEEEQCGYVVEFGDVNRLKNLMKKIIDNPQGSQYLVVNGRKYINENLNWASSITSIFERVYGSI